MDHFYYSIILSTYLEYCEMNNMGKTSHPSCYCRKSDAFNLTISCNGYDHCVIVSGIVTYNCDDLL